MKIIFTEQDVIDSVCVFIAAKDNDDIITGSSPEDVQDVTLTFDNGNYFARGKIYGVKYNFNTQDIKNAVAVFLSAYHNFDEDRLLVALNYDDESNEFGAEIIVQ